MSHETPKNVATSTQRSLTRRVVAVVQRMLNKNFFKVTRGVISKMDVDVAVYPAKKNLQSASGIHANTLPNVCQAGDAFLVTGVNRGSKFQPVILAVGPDLSVPLEYDNRNDLFATACQNAVHLASQAGHESLAFSTQATGNPAADEEAAKTLVTALDAAIGTGSTLKVVHLVAQDDAMENHLNAALDDFYNDTSSDSSVSSGGSVDSQTSQQSANVKKRSAQPRPLFLKNLTVETSNHSSSSKPAPPGAASSMSANSDDASDITPTINNSTTTSRLAAQKPTPSLNEDTAQTTRKSMPAEQQFSIKAKAALLNKPLSDEKKSDLDTKIVNKQTDAPKENSFLKFARANEKEHRDYILKLAKWVNAAVSEVDQQGVAGGKNQNTIWVSSIDANGQNYSNEPYVHHAGDQTDAPRNPSLMSRTFSFAPEPHKERYESRQKIQERIHEWFRTPDSERQPLDLTALSPQEMPPLPDYILAGSVPVSANLWFEVKKTYHPDQLPAQERLSL